MALRKSDGYGLLVSGKMWSLTSSTPLLPYLHLSSLLLFSLLLSSLILSSLLLSFSPPFSSLLLSSLFYWHCATDITWHPHIIFCHLVLFLYRSSVLERRRISTPPFPSSQPHLNPHPRFLLISLSTCGHSYSHPFILCTILAFYIMSCHVMWCHCQCQEAYRKQQTWEPHAEKSETKSTRAGRLSFRKWKQVKQTLVTVKYGILHCLNQEEEGGMRWDFVWIYFFRLLHSKMKRVVAAKER